MSSTRTGPQQGVSQIGVRARGFLLSVESTLERSVELFLVNAPDYSIIAAMDTILAWFNANQRLFILPWQIGLEIVADNKQIVTYLREQGSSLAKITVGEEYDEDQDSVRLSSISASELVSVD